MSLAYALAVIKKLNRIKQEYLKKIEGIFEPPNVHLNYTTILQLPF